ncbi:unknown [Alistipes sp. CAG:831]|nr:unknown [Alistipes sp. CAG:831]
MNISHKIINASGVKTVLYNWGYAVQVNKNISGLVISSESIPIAIAIWRENKKIISVILLYVENNYRRKGIGSLLLKVMKMHFGNQKAIMEYSDNSYNLTIMNKFFSTNGYRPRIEAIQYCVDFIGLYNIIKNKVKCLNEPNVLIKKHCHLSNYEIEQLKKEESTYNELYPYFLPKTIYTNDCSFYLSDGNIVHGWCIADNKEANKLFIHALFIKPQYRNKKYGLIILKHLLHKFSMNNNVNQLAFFVNSQNRKVLSVLELIESRKGIKTSKSYNYIVEFN